MEHTAINISNEKELQTWFKFAHPLCQGSKRFDKVFGIGANKTATTSLALAFRLLGLRVAPQAEGELLTEDLAAGHVEPLRRYIERFDAFQDVPFATKSYYALADALFPNSKFILTHRDSEEWFESFVNYHKKVLKIEGGQTIQKHSFAAEDYLYEGFRSFKFESDWLVAVDANYQSRIDWDLLFNKEHFIELYEARNREIVRHFSERPADLLTIDLTKEKTTAKLVEFLKLPAKLVTGVPHMFKT